MGMMLVVALAMGAAASGPVGQMPSSSAADTPRVLRAVAPAYPAMAVDAVVLGYVVLEATVDASGSVADVKILRTPALLNEEPLRAARRWRFAPDPQGSVRTAQLTFVFDLVDGEAPADTTFLPPHRIEVRARCRRGCDTLEKARESALFGLAPAVER